MKEVLEKIIERLEEAKEKRQPSVNGKTTMRDLEVYKMTIGYAIEIVNQAAEEYGNEWIPVEQRLPEENIEVDVTIEEIDGGRYTKTSWLQDGQWVIKKSPLKPTVIAWKEHPAPYQPKGDQLCLK